MPDPASATEAMPFAVLLDQYDATRNRLGYYEREINRTGGEPIVVERAEVARRRLDMARSRILEAVQQAHSAGVAEGIERAAKRIEEIADEDRYMSRHLMGQLAGEIRTLGRDQEGKTNG